MLMIKHFSPLLPKKGASLSASTNDNGNKGLPMSSVMALMSARVGSISDNKLGGWYSYRASKAAVNQIVKTFDNHLRTSSAENAMAIGLHPGTVKTGLSKDFWGNVKEGKLFEPDFAAERLVEVVKGLKIENGRGRCWDWEGKEIPP
jgi:NAD(P)-dependent dehydrogenase (short-subunit alcohol dehydrogenase family)